jgi:ferritin
MEENKNLEELLAAARKNSDTDEQTFLRFVELYTIQQREELENVKEIARKLSEGLKKYKNAHANLKNALAQVEE